MIILWRIWFVCVVVFLIHCIFKDEIRGGGIKHGYPIEDRNIIDNVTQKLISYGMTKADVWNFLDKLVKKNRSLGGKIRMFAAIEEWVTRNIAITFFRWLKNNENIESEFVRATFEDLKKSVLNRNFERTHEILVNDGIPTDSTMKEIIEPLINLYLDRANLGFLQKLLNVLYVFYYMGVYLMRLLVLQNSKIDFYFLCS